jgi:hypothetical protein
MLQRNYVIYRYVESTSVSDNSPRNMTSLYGRRVTSLKRSLKHLYGRNESTYIQCSAFHLRFLKMRTLTSFYLPVPSETYSKLAKGFTAFVEPEGPSNNPQLIPPLP